MTILHSVFYLNSKSNLETELEKPFSIQYWMKHNPGNQRIDRPCHQTCRWTQEYPSNHTSNKPTLNKEANHAKFNFCIIRKWLECEHIYSRSSAIKHQWTRNHTFTTNEMARRLPVFHKSSHSLICSFTLVALRFFGLLCEEIDPLNQVKDKKRKSVYGCNMADSRAGRYDQKCISRYFSKLYRFHGIWRYLFFSCMTGC